MIENGENTPPTATPGKHNMDIDPAPRTSMLGSLPPHPSSPLAACLKPEPVVPIRSPISNFPPQAVAIAELVTSSDTSEAERTPEMAVEVVVKPPKKARTPAKPKNRGSPAERAIPFIDGEEDIHSFPEIPALCQFVWLFQDLLNMHPLELFQLEQGFLENKTGNCVDALLTRVFIKRKSDNDDLETNMCFSRSDLDDMIYKTISLWLKQGAKSPHFNAFLLPRIHRGIEVGGEEEDQDEVMGDTSEGQEEDDEAMNPLDDLKFFSAPLSTRISIVHLLCEEAVLNDWGDFKTLGLSNYAQRETQIRPFGRDSTGAYYYSFGFADKRVCTYALVLQMANVVLDRQVPSADGNVRFGLVAESDETLKTLMKRLDIKNSK